MSVFRRQRRHLHLPIWTSVILMTVNVTLMVVLIVLLAQEHQFAALTIGAIGFGISVFGISFYLFLTIKEIQLNRRQANFVDSVTHELKTPIASLKLYLETLQMRELTAEQRGGFYSTMGTELTRLDGLINQLLKVGRLDAIGHESPPEEIVLGDFLRSCAESACVHRSCTVDEVFEFETDDTIVRSRRMLLEMIFGNLMDNAVKYGGAQPRVHVRTRKRSNDRIVVRVTDNGEGIPRESRNKVFRLFYREGDELARKQKGTGLGLHIVKTLVGLLKGRVTVESRTDGESGTVFVVDLPIRAKLTRREQREKVSQPASTAAVAELATSTTR
ncbi:MAG: sensor histidine kinase [Planctomycetaceae bacterium]